MKYSSVHFIALLSFTWLGAGTAAITDTDGDGLSDRQEVEVTATDPNQADTDGDGFSDQQEVVSGSDPNLATSMPSAGTLRARSVSLASDGTASIEFIARDVDARTLVLEMSTDLEDWEIDNAATIVPVSASTYRATGSWSGEAQYFRVRGTGEGGAVTIAAGFPQSQMTATEGDSDAVRVQFSSPFTGYFSYTLSGVDSDGKPITPITEGVEVDGQSSVTLPITFGDDSTVGLLSRYTIGLELSGVDSTPGGSQAQLVVLDNDEEWAGSLISGGQAISIRLRIINTGGSYTGTLISDSPSGFIPVGEYPMNLSRHLHDDAFELNPAATGVELARSSQTLPGSPMSAKLFLLAERGVGDQVVDIEGGRIEGTYLLALSKPGAPQLSSNPRGEFKLYRQPARPNFTEPALETSP